VACENKRLLHAYLDGELDAVRNIEFEQHLQTCPECDLELRNQQALRRSLSEANLYEPAPRSLRTRVRAALPREIRPGPIPQRRPAALGWLVAAAAIIVAFVLGAKVIPNVGARQQTAMLSQEIVASHIRSLQPGHLFDVQSTDQHTVKPWFDGKLDFAPPVTDLASQGFPLVGGRLDYLNHRDVAALVFQRQKHFINVFVWPSESKPLTIPEIQTIQGYQLIFWWRDGMYFCASSDLNVAELTEFAQLLGR
jgi:anti-sigma factor RsiW